jgi:hypothetical protein
VEPQNDDVLSAAVPEGYSFYKSGDDMVSGDSLKWYEHEADLLAVSAKHPASLFRLVGIGEDWPDIWVKFFHAGRTTKVPVVPELPAHPPTSAVWTEVGKET